LEEQMSMMMNKKQTKTLVLKGFTPMIPVKRKWGYMLWKQSPKLELYFKRIKGFKGMMTNHLHVC
jgi:hypothetical protein